MFYHEIRIGLQFSSDTLYMCMYICYEQIDITYLLT